MDSEGLVYIGKITEILPIEEADFIVAASVVCGKGGKWKGIIKKEQLAVGDLCHVYLPDALIPESPEMSFMKSSDWRVRMRRFRGSPSEVVIMPIKRPYEEGVNLGTDITSLMGVTKYHKPVPPGLQGKMIGEFPSFIPKTDEPNYQNAEGQEMMELLKGRPYYITEKCDGSSTTAFKYKGHFGICSRNWELARDETNGYWQIAKKYELEENLPEGYALQWETCGPRIQSNPMGLKEISAFGFSGYNILEHRYLTADELVRLMDELNFPSALHLDCGESFSVEEVDLIGEGFYRNGKPREGVVVRSRENLPSGKPISFKVINLDYEQ